jgi:hypothetical protein
MGVCRNMWGAKGGTPTSSNSHPRRKHVPFNVIDTIWNNKVQYEHTRIVYINKVFSDKVFKVLRMQ